MKKICERINEIPDELKKNREEIECDFLFCLYQDPSLISDYKNVIKNEEDIITEDGMFYYSMMLGMNNEGYKTFDDASVHLYLDNKPATKKTFESLNGFDSIHEICSLINPENIDGYYEKLKKNNMHTKLYFEGFNVAKYYDKFKLMTSDEIYDFLSYKISNVAVMGIDKTNIEDLSDGYDEWIDDIQSAKSIGFPIGSQLLNDATFGIHKGCLTLYVGGIGQGKTSSSIPLFMLPAIECGEDITVLCNEQTSKDYRAMIISTVLFSKIEGVHGMNRGSLVKGNLNEEQIGYIKKAVDWIKRQPGKIKFIELENYSAELVKKIIVRQSKLGCQYFFFDVLKAEDEASESAWAKLSETAKMLSVIAKNNDVAIIATAQIASDCLNRSYLDLSAIGKSRAIAEVATTVIGFRPVWVDEVNNIEVYKYVRGDNGTAVRTNVQLDKEKHYIEVFVMKNRFGPTNPQYILEFNQAFNTIRDVGRCDATFDHYQRGGKR